MKIKITPLILTFNEKENIGRTVRALSWAEEIVIVDSFSSDGTLDLARAAHSKVKVVQRAFDSFAAQCNVGLTHVATEWVLSVDADYILTPELIAEICALDPKLDVAGYSAEFRYCVFGRYLRSTIYPPRTVLYRRALASYRDEGHGHRVRISGRVLPLIGKIDHDDRKPLSRWITAQDRYAAIEAPHLMKIPSANLSLQDRLRRKVFITPWLMPVYLLFARGLLLDGWPGWYYVLQRTIAEMLLSLRLLTEKHGLEDQASSEMPNAEG